ncbi:MAG TPA: TolC family protein [Burkholderiales bacterium]|nr:TolC family protein [Burkholderiales bacterium]
MKKLLVAPMILLAGCASLSEDAGFAPVEQAVEARTGADAKWVRTEDEASTVRGRVKELLAQPLGPQEAVQIALLNNPGLQAAYAEVGIAEADLVEASRWRGPRFSFARLTRGDEVEYERSVFFDLLGLVTIPLSVRVEEKRLDGARNRAAAEALRVALDARKAWFAAVAAQETERYMLQVRDSAEASAELARRMAAVGNWSKLNQAREQAFYAETTAQLARARQDAVAARERLTRLLGLWGEDLVFRLPERLPELPASAREADDLEAQALAQRLDVQAARQDAEALAKSLGLTKVSGFVSLVEFGLHSNSATGEPRQRGWEIELALPIFDWGAARNARAERLYTQAVNRTTELAVQARSEVRETYSAYRTAYDLAKHYRDEIVPLRRRISEEALLRYNGMLMSVFELLADTRQQIAAVNSYIDSLHAFWRAESEFQMALVGRSPGAGGGAMRAAAPSAPQGGGH